MHTTTVVETLPEMILYVVSKRQSGEQTPDAGHGDGAQQHLGKKRQDRMICIGDNSVPSMIELPVDVGGG